ncbi:MAG: hypothetical protein Q7R85_03045 [bacterium]|nr:hypothetical protein [bacterium]
MTIIQPNRTNRLTNIVFAMSLLALLGVATWSIMLYNKTVNITHDISEKDQEYQALLAKNAELKNTLYTITDVKNLRRAAEALGFAPITRPEYVEEDKAPVLAAR